MISGKDVRVSKSADIKRVALSVIFSTLIVQTTRVCVASDWSSVDSTLGWAAAKDAELDELRGGFVLGNGMVVDLALATSVFINGQERFSDHFQLSNDVSIDQLRQVAVNNGPNNFAMTDAAMNNVAVIGNTLDNQVINLLRSVDITLSNIKGMDLSGLGQSSRGFSP
ncbi:hypothetical protein [Methylocaldum sp.]|uniref:hypothetical protein n=1 Tax=Methylocaldum sp. TaxID=1969727 RepID=UPI002D22983B|nr:hypothetical protein [Methylocaldum sp.]HYE35312.1 hypothetical protein [Methylocaldum sp.]